MGRHHRLCRCGHQRREPYSQVTWDPYGLAGLA